MLAPCSGPDLVIGSLHPFQFSQRLQIPPAAPPEGFLFEPREIPFIEVAKRPIRHDTNVERCEIEPDGIIDGTRFQAVAGVAKWQTQLT